MHHHHHHKKHQYPSNLPHVHPHPPFNIPTGPPAQWTPEVAQDYAKSGMMIEISTIPLYLYSQYSISPQDKSGAASTISGIVVQEMLHLALAGNLLSALNGTLALYDYNFIPQYPGSLLYQKVPLILEGATEANLVNFTNLEAPDPNNTGPPEDSNPDDYKSIGDFYQSLINGLKQLPASALANNADKQFTPQEFFNGEMVVIQDQTTATTALTTIIEQGEGGGPYGTNDHYNKFLTLAKNVQSQPLILNRVPDDPTTESYKGNDFVYKVSLSCDAAFCYLLQTIERVWQTSQSDPNRSVLVNNMIPLMTDILDPLANILVTQNFGSGVAAPCFNFYPPVQSGDTPVVLDPVALHTALVQALQDAAAVAPTSDLAKQLMAIADEVSQNLPPNAGN